MVDLHERQVGRPLCRRNGCQIGQCNRSRAVAVAPSWSSPRGRRAAMRKPLYVAPLAFLGICLHESHESASAAFSRPS